MLEVLRQVSEPFDPDSEMVGGASEVRWKYRLAVRLRQYDDCRAEDALRKLSEENICEDRGEGNVFCVKWTAEPGRQKISAAADLEKLSPDALPEEQIKIIRKYTKRPYENDYALHAIAKFLKQQAMSRSDFSVPLLVELFPADPETEQIAGRFPALASRGLEKLFSSSYYDQVWWGINLARYLGKEEFLPRAYAVAFEQEGNIDYGNRDEVEAIQTAAIAFFRSFEPQSLEYYRQVLYRSDFTRGKEYIISGVKLLDSQEVLGLFSEYFAYLETVDEPENALLVQRLRQKISRMEELGQ
ncbi:hypothetical protein GF1_06770 [Desulfolithobacter dissulfuricans]|uniref:Uncharacterized protein n=1 Tax=Desulfolithobacter dissulfuricans TaxID=2795293 RepID=A0A915U8S9_9BACT|nr:hypothetical protein [Desulfolithobacter dissulfuricans]BCO08301.1 hypothetical protein GF1_06770 [Desulfolithobacter dissulfuricans]